jgi:hypothetical protein
MGLAGQMDIMARLGGHGKRWPARAAWAWLAAGALLAVISARPAAAQGGIEVLAAPPPVYEFGQRIEFQLLARGPSDLTRIELFVRPPGAQPVSWGAIQFERGPEAAVSAVFDLALYTLPPFAAIEYWWVIEDATGARLETAPQLFQYEDDRFTWHRLSAGGLTVHWYDGDAAFGQAALDTAAGALPRINRDLRAPLPAHTNLYVYATAADIQAALRRLGRAWADGHADPALGVVLVVVANDLRADFSLQREIPHELTHVLMYHAAGPNLGRVPLWLNEGLAVMNQGQPEASFAARLEAARASGQFFDLIELCAVFPAEVEAARLAYAQSESVVRYIRDRFGSEGVHALVQAYSAGANCEAGVQAALGLSLEALKAAWLREAVYGDPEAGWPALAPWVVLAGVVCVAPLGFLFLGRRR